jgi:glycosyltransferase involved in cell wall biosynthesis
MEIIHRKESSYVIAVPEAFISESRHYEWPYSENVSIDLIPDSIVKRGEGKGLLLSAFKRTRILKDYIQKHQANRVLLIGLMQFIPFLPLFISSRINVYGIIYYIYLYEWRNFSIIRKIIETLKYKIISSHNCIQKAFILNDPSSAAVLNRRFGTSKFICLVDPYNDTGYVPHDIRSQLNINQNQNVFLHFGGLSGRKGTISILQAIALLPVHEIKKYTFIFAGKVYPDIRDEFYKLTASLKTTCKIIVFDKFCENELIADLCFSCNAILMPYSNTSQSSGVLGYAAHYGKPVIAPSTGLIGKLVKQYCLGVCLKEITPQSIASSITKYLPYRINSQYKEKTKTEDFASLLMSFL